MKFTSNTYKFFGIFLIILAFVIMIFISYSAISHVCNSDQNCITNWEEHKTSYITKEMLFGLNYFIPGILIGLFFYIFGKNKRENEFVNYALISIIISGVIISIVWTIINLLCLTQGRCDDIGYGVLLGIIGVIPSLIFLGIGVLLIMSYILFIIINNKNKKFEVKK